MRADRTRIVTWAFGLGAAALVGRAAWVQLWQHDQWVGKGRRQYVADAPLPAPRGTIRDVNGQVLAESREMVTLVVDLQNVRNREAVARALTRAGAAPAVVRRVGNPAVKTLEVQQRFLPDDVAELQAMRGVKVTPVAERVAAPSEAVRRLVGRATPTRGLDGLEFALDSLLAGRNGTRALLRDARGLAMGSPDVDGDSAVAGHAITLTINAALQDIAERALRDAQAATGATGGDVVVLDPRDGTIQALVSRRPDARSTAATTLTEPFEPGSTLKPFYAGRLLDLRRARVDEAVPTYNGTMKLGTRTITDVHRAARMSLAEVIAQSSNIGIVQFAARLSPREQFEMLRDLGLGTPTGVPYPLEAGGTLREPKRWSATSAASLAMGYEVAVTPLQLAVAYAAVANGGEVLQPALIKEIAAPDGRVVWTHRRQALRRVFSPAAAAAVRTMLVGVVEGGTSEGADLANYSVGGKSGTARRFTKGQGYAAGAYTASFVGLFPANDPQLVVVVKLDNPQGMYYGGKTAAPVAKAVIEAALAARGALPDVPRLAASAKPVAETAAARLDSSGAPRESLVADVVAADTGDVPVVVQLGEAKAAAPAAAPRPVPDVRGLPPRRAVLALHQAGFRVQWRAQTGGAAGTDPAAGTVLKAGALVRYSAGGAP